MGGVVFPQFYLPQPERDTTKDTVIRSLFPLLGQIIQAGVNLYEGSQNREQRKLEAELADAQERERMAQEEAMATEADRVRLIRDKVARAEALAKERRDFARQFSKYAMSAGLSGDTEKHALARQIGGEVGIAGGMGKFLSPQSKKRLEEEMNLSALWPIVPIAPGIPATDFIRSPTEARLERGLTPEEQAEEYGKAAALLPAAESPLKAIEEERTRRMEEKTASQERMARAATNARLAIARLSAARSLVESTAQDAQRLREMAERAKQNPMAVMNIVPGIETMSEDEVAKIPIEKVEQIERVLEKMPYGKARPDVEYSARESVRAPVRPPPQKTGPIPGRLPEITREQFEAWVAAKVKGGMKREDAVRLLKGKVIVK